MVLEDTMHLEEIRAEINRVDEQLLPLFLRRMRLSARVAAWKKENGVPVADPAREEEILSAAAARSGELRPQARALYAEILRLSREYQEELLSGTAPSAPCGEVGP